MKTRRDLLRGLTGIVAARLLPGCAPTNSDSDADSSASDARWDHWIDSATGGADARDASSGLDATSDGSTRDVPSQDAPANDAPNRDASATSGRLIARADWASHGLMPPEITAGAGWFIWGGAACAKIDDFFRVNYPDTRSGGTSAGIALIFESTVNLPEVHVEFQARLPAGPVGPKFYKVHGDNGGTEYANTTYGLDGGGVPNMYISFGDGTTTGNDVAQRINFDGSNPTWIGRNVGRATVTYRSPPASFVLDNAWHTFRIHHKFNSGTTRETEVSDGVFYVEIDGVVYVSAVNLFNRHPQNIRRISQLTFGDWAQNDRAGSVDFKNIKVSVDGWV